jgi:hypothetical protein
MGLLVSGGPDVADQSPPVYVRLERFEVSRDYDLPTTARIQLQYNVFANRGDEYQTTTTTIPKVFTIFANYDLLFDIPLVSYIYYYYTEQLKAMNFQVTSVFEGAQTTYEPPDALTYPTSVQPDYNPYHYQFSSIVYFISPKQPSPV